MKKGLFIVIEGLDGTGKSSVAALLADKLRVDTGREVRTTHQPGGTPVGTELRKLLLDPNVPLTPEAETVLMAADKAIHVNTFIRPLIEAGVTVICDRYLHSSIAYQGWCDGVGHELVRDLNLFAVTNYVPDLTIILTTVEEDRSRRLEDRNAARERYETVDPERVARLQAGYAAAAVDERLGATVTINPLTLPETVQAAYAAIMSIPTKK